MSEATELKPYRELTDGMVNVMIPTRFISLATGVKLAKQDSNGRVTLVYVNEETEFADLPELELSTCENFFEVVGAVQAMRPSE